MSLKDDYVTSVYGPGSGYDPIAEQRREKIWGRRLITAFSIFVLAGVGFLWTPLGVEAVPLAIVLVSCLRVLYGMTKPVNARDDIAIR